MKIPASFADQLQFLEDFKKRKKIFYEKGKRILDLLLASFIILITSPLWLFIALAIKLEDRGPIFSYLERIGKNGKPFFLLNFRSSKKEPATKFRLLREVGQKNGHPIWIDIEDPRIKITKVGKILRKIHLEQLPQMINVLKGEISLVGPRPERPEFVNQLEKEIPYYHLRHLIKPGFTGWAQIKFRYGKTPIDNQEKFEYDLYYIKNRSFFLDLKILFKTLRLFFQKVNDKKFLLD
jgi:lipopolysaccharide/colanic/teichoic acid biosynthesis glycosyltransferase